MEAFALGWYSGMKLHAAKLHEAIVLMGKVQAANFLGADFLVPPYSPLVHLPETSDYEKWAD